MRRWLIPCVLVMLLSPTFVGALTHPGIVNNAAEFTLMRQKLAAGEQPWTNAFNKLDDVLDKKVNYVPTAPVEIECLQGQGCDAAFPLLHDGSAAYEFALRWVLRGTPSDGAKAVEILNDWAVTNTTITGGNNRLLFTSWYSPRMAMAAEIMAYTAGTPWTSGQITTFKNWVNNKIRPNLKGYIPTGGSSDKNNWAAFGAWARSAWGVFLDDPGLYDLGQGTGSNLGAVDMIENYIDDFGFGTAVLDGFTYETCRTSGNVFGTRSGGDLVHTFMAMGALAAAAEVAKHQGTADLYAFKGTDGWGLHTTMSGHGPWFYFPERPGSTIATWPCLETFPGQNGGNPDADGIPPFFYAASSWRMYYHRYGDPLFLSLSNWQGDAIDSLHNRNQPVIYDRLTHAGSVTEDPDDPVLRYASQAGSGTACTLAAPCTFAQAVTNLPPRSTVRLIGTVDAQCDNCLPSGVSGAPTILESATLSSTPITVGSKAVSVNPGTATLRTSTGVVLSIRAGREWITVRNLSLTTTGTGVNPTISLGDTATTTKNLVLENLDVQAPTRSGATRGITLSKQTDRIVMSKLRVHRVGPTVDFAVQSPAGHGVEIRGADHRLEDSDIYDNAADGVEGLCSGCSTGNPRMQLRHNRVFGNGGKGIVLGDGVDQVVTGNLIYNNGAEGHYATGTALRHQVYNNSLYNNSRQTGENHIGLFMNTGSSGVIRNNIVIGHPGTEISLLPTTTSVKCSHNLSSDATAPTNCTTTTLNAVDTDTWVNPTHTTLASKNFTLKAGSAAINTGTAVVCGSADVTAGFCTPALTLNGFIGIAPDQGALESGDTSTPDQLTHSYGFNNDVQDSSGFGNHGTNVGASVTFDATNKVEGSHSALFNAATDRIDIPMGGFTVDTFTIALWFRVESCTGLPIASYLIGHSSATPSYANRIQIYLDNTCRLNLGLGGNHTTATDVATLVADTPYRVVLVVDHGTYKLVLNNTTKASGTYTGLTQIGANMVIGNTDGDNVHGFGGQIDAVRIANYPWTNAEIAADCASFCGTPTLPFDPLMINSCSIGPIAANIIGCTVQGNPDPAECATLANFDVTYDTVAQTTTACTLTGSSPVLLTLTVAVAAVPSTVVELSYEPETEFLPVINLILPVFDPFVLNTCATDVTGLIINCTLVGNPNPGVCSTLSNFVVRDACPTVPVTSCSVLGTEGEKDSRLILHRSIPPVDETVSISLTYVPTAQSVGVTNQFDPDGVGAGITQSHWRCRPDSLGGPSLWKGPVDQDCRVASPGRTSLRVAVTNESGSILSTFASGLFCARNDGSGLGAFQRVTETVNSHGLRLAPMGALPDQATITDEVLPRAGGITFAPVGVVHRQASQPVAVSLPDDAQLEHEFPLELAAGIPQTTQIVCRVAFHDGTLFNTYTGLTGCTTDCGASVNVSPPEFLRR